MWFSIRVELIEGRGDTYWPRPGRLIAASSRHSFAQLATAIDHAFARWDISHVHEFQLPDGTKIGRPDPDSEDEVIDERRERLSRLELAQQFVYVFDFGDYWAHLCTVGEKVVDPRDVLGLVPDKPMPYFGWGSIPDQYGRAWDEDDGATRLPQDPELKDLPPLQPGWGPHPHED
jgi:pRiA4b ORF-3-like protein